MHKRILITPGEPAGIGPDITLQIAQQAFPAELIAVACPTLLTERAAQLGLPIRLLEFTATDPAGEHLPGTLKIMPVPLPATCQAGQLNVQNANYVTRCLEIATHHCLQGLAQALVTGPVQKSILNDAGIAFTGHTEFLAALCNNAKPIMLFVADEMKVALLTTHLPLSAVPKAITQPKLIALVRQLHHAFQTVFKLPQPKILVAGLNPHAGENGHLGREEIDIIEPALRQLRDEQIDVQGPLSADTLFTEKYANMADVILAMYHDQALPVVKYLGFGHAVNVTLGLPFLRTSVDHGTALDLAGTGQANAKSLAEAIQLAIKYSPH